ncbi:MAG TPA: putative sulfate exporter family transporter [Nitrospirota bacterium]|nr:putative sulfate exporter family transporter [Nitrospirota bacterium]
MEEKTKGISEDWLAVWIGLFIFIVSLGSFVGTDVLNWGVTTAVWTDMSKALKPISAAWLGGFGSLLLTYVVLLVVMTIGAAALKADLKNFIIGFTVVFWISYICWILGSYANIAVTTAPDMKKFGITWSLKLTAEAGFIIALLVGLFFGNFVPSFANSIKAAVRPELYIKTAIVILGGSLGLMAAEKLGLATAVMFRGLCAIVEAYLIYWALVYFIARKYFKFSREWAAPLASGISICGVSAAIATGGAIKARPVVPIMVSSLVVIFAVVELIVLPFFAETFLYKEPMVAGAWMGLAVKTDGAAVASGAVTEGLILGKAAAEGIMYQPEWIKNAAAVVKVFIDIFIGVWAFVLAIVWCSFIECKPGEKVRPGQIWDRFPKFVIGYIVTFIIILLVCLPASKKMTAMSGQVTPLTKQIAAQEAQLAAMNKQVADEESKLAATKPKDKKAIAALKGQIANDKTSAAALADKIGKDKAQLAPLNDQLKEPKATMNAARASTGEANVFRGIFFVMTFFTIGLVSNFKKLWEEGIGRLAAVYVISLFGFIIWIGLVISWIFFHGVKPPLVG